MTPKQPIYSFRGIFGDRRDTRKESAEMERESDVEHYFVQQCKRFGYLTYKFVSPGQAGVPDRIVIGDEGWLTFIEFKKNTNEYPRALQFKQMRRLTKAGARVIVARSKAEVDWVFNNGAGSEPKPWPVLEEEANRES